MNEGYTKVFVSLDGTEQQDFVLARAIKVAANNGAKLIIGHVIDSTALESAGSYPVDLVNGLEEAFNNSIAKQLEEAKANPDIPEVEVMIRTGRIRETLKDEMLDVVKPDLVLCGARGLSSIKYALLGSISTFLLRNTDCDILVVKYVQIFPFHFRTAVRSATTATGRNFKRIIICIIMYLRRLGRYFLLKCRNVRHIFRIKINGRDRTEFTQRLLHGC